MSDKLLKGVVVAYDAYEQLVVEEADSGETLDVWLGAVVGEWAGKQFCHEIPIGSTIQWDIEWEPIYILKR
jgi:hypothetical protein